MDNTKYHLSLCYALSRCPPKAVIGGAFQRRAGLECIMLGLRMCVNK